MTSRKDGEAGGGVKRDRRVDTRAEEALGRTDPEAAQSRGQVQTNGESEWRIRIRRSQMQARAETNECPIPIERESEGTMSQRVRVLDLG